MRLLKTVRIAISTLTLAILATGLLLLTSCSINNTRTPPQPSSPQILPPSSRTPPSSAPVSPGNVMITAMITEIAGSNVSLKTAAGPLVLKFNSGTVVLKLDGSPGTIKDLRAGMNIEVSYDAATNIMLSIQIQ